MNRDAADDTTPALDRYQILCEMGSDYAFRTRIREDGVPVLEWISESWERDFGYRPSGPEDLYEHVHPDDRPLVAEHWAEILSGRSIEGELRMVPKSGRELWVRYRVRPIVEAGRVVGTYGAMQDVHDRKMAEELWRRAEERVRAQFQSSPVPTFTWQRVDEDFVLIDFNHAAVDFTRGEVSRSIGRTLREMYPDRPDVQDEMNEAYATGRTITADLPGYEFATTGESRDLVITYARVAPDTVLVHAVDRTTASSRGDA